MHFEYLAARGGLSFWRRWYFTIRIWLGLRFVEQPARQHPQLPPPPVFNIGFGQTFKVESSLNEVYAMEYLGYIPLFQCRELTASGAALTKLQRREMALCPTCHAIFS